MPQLKDTRAIIMFKGDEGKYELELDFGGKIGNLVNLEDLDMTTKPAGKYRIVKKDVTETPNEPTMVVYHLERF
ncbi:MAG TPA: hypothetical protein V6D00_15655 [Pantanalinema sp.]